MTIGAYLVPVTLMTAAFIASQMGHAPKGPPRPTPAMLQVLGSRWWLARYRYGSAEWPWRSLTYGRRLPLARESALPAAGAVAT